VPRVPVKLCPWHEVCFGCVKLWCTRHGGHSCPTCREPYAVYESEDFHRLQLEYEKFQRLGDDFVRSYNPHVCVGSGTFAIINLNNRF